LGDGTFHPTAFMNHDIDIPIYSVFPEQKLVEITNPRGEEKRINMLPHIIKDKNSFGIFVTIKSGQQDLKTFKDIKKLLEKNEKEVTLFVGDNISNDKILGTGIEVLVNTACPRIRDDFKNYKILIVNPSDVTLAFWEEK